MLELRDIHAGYGGTTVLDGVSITVPDQSVVALLGPNGSGKTTTMRVAAGQVTAGSGTLLLDGRDVTASRPDELARAGVCHVPEGRSVFPNLTVEENLRVFVRGRTDRDLMDHAAEAFPALRPLRRRMAGTLSGGQQQMLALARVYVSGPKVALLDEVSMGLAPVVVKDIFTFLPRLRELGMSLLIVEQYATQALGLADYVYVMAKGEIRFAGEPGELEDAMQ